jgi:hypothetical protein
VVGPADMAGRQGQDDAAARLAEPQDQEDEPVEEGGQQEQQGQSGPQSLAEAMREAEEKPQSVVWLVLVIGCLFAMGVWDFAMDVESNGCQMTYMYEYPKYIPVPMSKSVTKTYPNYGLYVYGEGDLVEV